MIGELISKIISGAAVGYITNDWAIDMLFRKRFGLGGVILRTREEFILNISALVEREIVNHHTLQKEISENPQGFENALQLLLNEFLTKALPDNFTFADIKGFEQSLLQWQEVVQADTHQFIVDVLHKILPQIAVADLLSPRQTTQIADFLTTHFGEVLRLVKTEIATNLYQDLQNAPVSELVDGELVKIALKNINQKINALPNDLKNDFKLETLDLLNDVWVLLQFDTLITNLSAQLSDKKLRELFGDKSAEAVSNELIARLKVVLKSEQGTKLALAFGDFLTQVLENEKTTVFEILSNKLADNFENFLSAKLPPFLDSILAWLEARKDKLELIIDEAFRKNIKWKFQDFVMKLFVGSISQYANVVDNLTKLIDKHRENPEETATRLVEQFIGFLKTHTIGDIAKQIKNQKNAIGLGQIFADNVDNALDNIKNLNIAAFFDNTLGELLGKETIEKFLHDWLQKLLFRDLTERFLFAEKSGAWAATEVEKLLDNEQKKPIAARISQESYVSFLNNIETQTLHYAERRQTEITDFAHNFIKKQSENKHISDWVKPEKIAEALKKPLTSLSAVLLNKKPTALFAKVPISATTLRKLISDRLPLWLKGNIEKVVQSSLNRMAVEKVQDLVERFMGKELKPITLLGALLGAIAGAGLFLLPVAQTLWINLVIASLAYGITGYGTNWLALKMVFKPYKKHFIFKIPVPFTPGVVARNQSRFAKNMGNFVVNGLLNKESLKDNFERNKDNFKIKLTEYLQNNDFEAITTLLEQNKNEWADKGVGFLWDYLQTNELNISALRHLNFEKANTEGLEKNFADGLSKPETGAKVAETLAKTLFQLAGNATPFADLLSETVKTNFSQTVDKLLSVELNKFFQQINNQEERLIKTLNPAFQSVLGLPLCQLFSKTQTESLTQELGDILKNKLIDKELHETIFKFIDEKLAEELAPQKNISELFDGALSRLLENNLDALAENLIGFGLAWLKDNRDLLAEKVYEEAYQNSKAAALYKETIKATVVELATQGIPYFFSKENSSLKDLIGQEVGKIAASPVGDLQIEVEKNRLQSLVGGFLQRTELNDSLQRLLKLLVDEVFKTELSAFLNMANINALADLRERLDDELFIIFSHFKTYGTQQSEVLGKQMLDLLQPIIEKHWQTTSVKDVFMGAELSHFQHLAEKWIDALQHSETFNNHKENLVRGIFTIFKQRNLGEMLDIDVLQNDINKIIKTEVLKPENEAFIKTKLSSLVATLLANALPQTQRETKEFLSDTLVNALFLSLETHIDTLLNAVDLRRIVETEITAMHPKQIENLFYSFAQKYFVQLINYGFGFGIVLGLLADFLLLLLLSWLV